MPSLVQRDHNLVKVKRNGVELAKGEEAAGKRVTVGWGGRRFHTDSTIRRNDNYVTQQNATM